MLPESMTNLDIASPALSATAAPTTAAPSGQFATAKPALTWQQMLAAIAGQSGAATTPFANLVPTQPSQINAGIPLYTPPQQPVFSESAPQKQTTEGDVNKYSQLISTLFSGAA